MHLRFMASRVLTDIYWNIMDQNGYPLEYKFEEAMENLNKEIFYNHVLVISDENIKN